MKIDNVLSFMHNELKENVLDYPRKRLCPVVFNPDMKMKSSVKKDILNRFNSWKEKYCPDLKVVDIFVLGSITTYQYNDSSDIDVNIITSESKEKLSKLWRSMPSGNDYKGHPVNFYLSADTHDIDISKTLYNLNSDSWVREPKEKDTTAPGRYSLEIAKFFMDAIDLRIGELERDEKELIKFKELLKSKDARMEEEEIKDEIERIKTDIKADKDSIKLALYIVKGFRKEGFVDGDNKFQFSINVATDDANKSLNNLIYKELERFGYLAKMMKIKENNNG